MEVKKYFFSGDILRQHFILKKLLYQTPSRLVKKNS